MSGVLEGGREYREGLLNASPFIDGDPRRPATTTMGRKGGQQYTEEDPEKGESDKYAGLGIGVAGLLAENLACHPFIILRRQCQCHVESSRVHTTPLTLVPVFVNLYRWQGVAVLWKGIGSSLTIRGLTLGMEDCLSKVTPWPKEVDKHSSLRSVGQHLLLKAVSAAIITPFYSASLVETVQSDIASEKPGVLDVFKDGIVRLVSWSDPRCGRMLPVWVLIPPQVIHSVAHYIITSIVQGLWLQVMKTAHREYQRLRGAVSRDPQLSNLPGLSQYQAQAASLAGHLTADALLFPLETVLHRLHLQGTRSIIDNLDTGTSVVPILTRYEGVADCFSTILQEEGFSGLFKGFGAMILQYGVHFLIIKFSSQIISQVAQLFSNSPRLPFPDPRQDESQAEARTQADNARKQEELQERKSMVDGRPLGSITPRGALTPTRSPKVSRRHTPVEPLEPLEETSPVNYSGIQKPTLPGFGVPTLPSFGSSNLPGLPIQTHDPLDYSTPRGGGLPSLLSFSSNSNSPSHMRSPPRRLLPEPELEISRHDDPLNSQPWRSMDS